MLREARRLLCPRSTQKCRKIPPFSGKKLLRWECFCGKLLHSKEVLTESGQFVRSFSWANLPP